MSQILEYRLLGEANLILPRPTLAAMEMTFVEYVQTLIEVVGVVVLLVMFKILHLVKICTFTSACLVCTVVFLA